MVIIFDNSFRVSFKYAFLVSFVGFFIECTGIWKSKVKVKGHVNLEYSVTRGGRGEEGKKLILRKARLSFFCRIIDKLGPNRLL